MKFSFHFSNVLGAVYRKGDAIFTPDGNSLVCPVGNRICIYDLRSHISSTLPIESRFNYERLAISPSGHLLIAINEEGEAHFITLLSKKKFAVHRFNNKIRHLKFSPNGKYFAVCKIDKVFIYRAPDDTTCQTVGHTVLERVFSDFADDTTCVDWSDDSSLLAVGSNDGLAKLYWVGSNKFQRFTLSGHSDPIVRVFFEENSTHVNTIGRNGQLSIWECNATLQQLSSRLNEVKEESKPEEIVIDERTEDAVLFAIDRCRDDANEQQLDIDDPSNEPSRRPQRQTTRNNETQDDKFRYSRLSKHYLNDYHKYEKWVTVSCCSYHRMTKILVAGFSNGVLLVYELPDVTLIHSLSVSQSGLSTLDLNKMGDWIAVGCENQNQLLVWEWQSETYVLKQQAHASSISSLCYSRDGLYIVTGGIDGKIKVWDVRSGYCFVTFSEHTSGVTSVIFSHNRKFVASSSLDGTVRAFDLHRYRNFRTFASPRPVQFSCLAIDSNDEFVAAGARDIFEIFIWSMRLGQLVECLAGHESPVSGIAFNPVVSSCAFVTVSWDKTLRLWNAVEGEKDFEVVQLVAEALCVAYKPDGKEIAVSTLNGHIIFFDPSNAVQVGSIEGRNDLGSGRSDTDQITAKKNLEAKAFLSICYSADGNFIIAGGQSKNICIYHAGERILLKKFEITQNRSLDAIDDYINYRKMTEFGNIDLIEERTDNDKGVAKIRLPGVVQGDMATRSFKPEIRVFGVVFSPTGLAWSAATTEGVLIYSYNNDVMFDPYQLEIEVTTDAVKEEITNKNYLKALVMALKLSESDFLQYVLESVPVKDIDLIVTSLPTVYVDKLLKFLSITVDTTHRIEFYLAWIERLLSDSRWKTNQIHFDHASLLTVHRNLMKKHRDLSKVCDFNKYTMKFIFKKQTPIEEDFMMQE